MIPRPWLLVMGLLGCLGGRGVDVAGAAEGLPANRFVHLDEFSDPYLPSSRFAKLTTPQWIGETNIDAAVVLAIDDMSQYAPYEVYLRPILERLKQIDGRGPASIMGNRINLAEPQLQGWLREGVSIETHTTTHPCPMLVDGNLAKAKEDYDRAVDLFFQVPGNQPVGFRTPCMDGMNTTSPRLYSEILMGLSPAGHFLRVSSSVAHLFAPGDPELPPGLLNDPDGRPRFAKYLAKGFVNYIENYPYPYVVARGIWELPFSVPDDYQGFALQGGKNPATLADMEAALDLVVRKQGLYTQCFHPYAWIGNTQMVAFIDHAVAVHGGRVRFLSLREVDERLTRNLLGGQPLRAANGGPNGVGLLDLDGDGYLDVVIGNDQLRQTRVWDPKGRRWKVSPFPASLVQTEPATGRSLDGGARFGIVEGGVPVLLLRNGRDSGAWRFESGAWVADESLLSGLEIDGKPVLLAEEGRDRGFRLRDLDGDGSCEAIVGNESQSGVWHWMPAERRWRKAEYTLPSGVAIVDAQGRDNGVRFQDFNGDGAEDVLLSNSEAFSLHLMVPRPVLGFVTGWSREVLRGTRGQLPEIPPVSRGGAHPNNGAWFAGGEMRLINEETSKLPDLMVRIPFSELLAGLQPPPLTPAESLSRIQVPDGFTVDLVAQEPLVRDPVALDWGEDGRLWVVEMHDYPLGLDGHGQPGGTVRFLEDTDGDGRYDRSTVFLDHVNFPNGILPWHKGVLISAAPGLLYAEDTDGDGRADKVVTLFSGFVEGNQQHRFNGFDYGLDNWLYGANGDSGGVIRRGGDGVGPEVNIRGRDFRLRPDDGVFEAVAGHTQFGRRRDDWGNWFGNANPIWLWHYWVPDHYLKRNPRLPVERISRETATYPDAGRVLSIGRKQQRMNDVGSPGSVTSANSPTPYRDRLFGEEFENAVFISEPVFNAIRCEVLRPDGVSFTSTRWRPEVRREFFASSDPWTRPTGLKVGPDGALYVPDMYRQYIEHPEWILEDVKSRVNLRAGENLGRIYRISPKGARLRPTPRLDRLSDADLGGAIDSPNGWQRDTVQRKVVSDRRTGAEGALRRVARTSGNPKARISALCTLDGLGLLGAEDLAGALADSHPGVREQGVRLCEPQLHQHGTHLPSGLASAILERVNDRELRVRFQAALSLGEWEDPRAAAALARLALGASGERELGVAIASASARMPGAILDRLLDSGSDLDPIGEYVGLLSAMVAGRGESSATRRLVTTLAKPVRDAGRGFRPWQVRAFSRLLQELAQGGRPIDPATGVGAALPGMLAPARRILPDTTEPIEGRVAAAWLLGRDPAGEVEDTRLLASVLEPQAPQPLQAAGLGRLSELNGAGVAGAILERWDRLLPGTRGRVFDLLLRRDAWVSVLLDRIQAGDPSPADIGVAFRQRLLTHPNREIQARAARVLQQGVRADRQALVAAYLPGVTTATGKAPHGAALFQQHCATCHRLNNEGEGAAPDLASLVDRSPERVLVALLDPNRAVEDRYRTYVARGRNGDEITGMLVGETANSVTLATAAGARETLLRQDLETLRSTRLSLMPEGFEQALKPQDVADLIAYLDAVAAPPKPRSP